MKRKNLLNIFLFNFTIFNLIILIFIGCRQLAPSQNKELNHEFDPTKKTKTDLTTITKKRDKSIKTSNEPERLYISNKKKEKEKPVNYELEIIRSKFIFDGKKLTHCNNDKLPIQFENLPNNKQIALVFSFNGDLSVDNISITGNKGNYLVENQKYLSLTKSNKAENQYLLIASPTCETYWEGKEKKFNIFFPMEGPFILKVKYNEQTFEKNFFVKKQKHELDPTFKSDIFYKAKKKLKELGYRIKSINYFKDDLKKPLMAFQKDNKLAVTGLLNSSTRKALGLPIGWKAKISNIKILDAKIINTNDRVSCESSNLLIPDNTSFPKETILLVKYQLEYTSIYNEFIGTEPIKLTTTYISQSNKKYIAIGVQDIIPHQIEKDCIDCVRTTMKTGHRQLTISDEMRTKCSIEKKRLTFVKPPNGKYSLTFRLSSDEVSEKMIEFSLPFSNKY